MVMKKILIALALLLTGIASGSACTGISFLAEDGGYVQARTIEWGDSYLPSEYVVVPRGQELVSYTPTGVNGLRFFITILNLFMILRTKHQTFWFLFYTTKAI